MTAPRLTQKRPLWFSPANGRKLPAMPAPMTASGYRTLLQNVPWLFNPWTGMPRHRGDVLSDPKGTLILPPGETLMHASRS